MMLKPSIDKLMDEVNSKYSLVILAGKRAHELENGLPPALEQFKSVKPVQQALEEIASGRVVVHPNPKEKRERIRLEKELAYRALQEENAKIERQIEEEGSL